MKVSRNITNVLNFIIDQLLPPILRDSRLFAFCVLYPIARSKTRYFLDFRDRAYEMSDKEFMEYYAQTADVLDRTTDLGARSFRFLVESIEGQSVLEVGAGNGALAETLAIKNSTVAVDMLAPRNDDGRLRRAKWFQADAEKLPFADDSFDVVVCTHTLEHLRDFDQGLAELRRVARNSVIAVVPLQRPYRYSPDLHISYFPYAHSFVFRARPRPETYKYRILDGDLVYEETITGQ